MKQTTTAKAAFLASILKSGEEYAGIILGKNGEPDYHLILLLGRRAHLVSSMGAADCMGRMARTARGNLPARTRARDVRLMIPNAKLTELPTTKQEQEK